MPDERGEHGNIDARNEHRFGSDASRATAGQTPKVATVSEATFIRRKQRVGDRMTLLQAMSQDATTLDSVRANTAANAESGCKTSDVENGDVGFIDLIVMVNRMTESGDPESVLELYEQWLRQHPVDPLRHGVYFNYGSLLNQMGRPAQAASALAEAIRLAPGFLPAYVNLGVAFEALGRLTDAVSHWLHVADWPASTDSDSSGYKIVALRHLARVYEGVADHRRAEEALRRYLEIEPHQRDIIQHWIATREILCDWPVIAPWGELTRSDLMAALSPLALAIHTNDPMYQLANAWYSFQQDVVRSPVPHTAGRWIPPEQPVRRQRPLRIGYVSPDLRGHAIGFLTAELFERHDRAKVEVFAYYSGRLGPDTLQARIRQAVDHWVDIVGWSDKRAARQVVNDEIDILIDLGGHTGESPAAMFALRPAPVIVNWLGYPGSMGTPHHQYIIADETIIPTPYEKYYSERVVRLPCYQPTDRKRIVAEPPSRLELGLTDGTMVYCCFNGTQKITPEMFRCWMTILARVPHAVLWLLSGDALTDEQLREQAVCHGISPDRLIFAPRKANAEHLARYPLADLFLDTSPYGAHTTASDALWMGVPVLTMAGHSFASRVCASLVNAAGLAELVCDSPEAYIEHAVELGNRPRQLIALREKLRAGRDRCILFDMSLLVTQLESLYARMWDDYLSDQTPEPDLANLTIYHEIGSKLDHEAADFLNLQDYEQTYTTALACRDSLSPISPDRRLWHERHRPLHTQTGMVAPESGMIALGNHTTHPPVEEHSCKSLLVDLTRGLLILDADLQRRDSMKSLNVVSKNGTSDLVSKVDDALNVAIMKSDIDSNVSFYSIEGMSGKKYRHFINTLVNTIEQPRYLEVGSWAGSTLCAAIYGNNVDAIAIDNWSEFGGPKEAFLHHVAQYKTPGAEVQLIEADFRHVDYRVLGRRNIYLYDGPHEEQDQYDGLNMVIKCLDRQFVFIVDDWNWDRVRSGTFSAIKNCGLKILFSAEIRTTLNGLNPDVWLKHSDWHNGYLIAVLERTDDGSIDR